MSSAFTIKFDIKDAELVGRLQGLEEKIRVKTLKDAARAAATVLEPRLRGLLAKKYGYLRASIGDRVKRYKSGKLVLVVGPRSKSVYIRNGKKHQPAHYAHLVEKGHRFKGGKRARASRMFERTVQAYGPMAMDQAIAVMRKQIEESWQSGK